MEKLFTALLISMCVAPTSAQHLLVNTYVETTIVSPKVGTAIGYLFRNHGEMGIFYQKALLEGGWERSAPRSYEKEFYGIFMAGSVFHSEFADIKLQVRTGVSNHENFVITPSVLAYFTGFKNLRISAGVGTRVFRPTFQSSLVFLIPVPK